MSKTTTITFDKGYDRLREIADEVNQAEVPVDRMGDLFAEGKGLEKALTDYLAAQKGRIEKIERGEEVQTFRIVGGEGDEDERPDRESDRNGAGGEESLPF